MSFDEKKQLLHWLFDGKDQEGTKYGIYIMSEKGIGGKIDYFMYGRITGLRTVKGDDIDYSPGDGDDDSGNGGGWNILKPRKSTKSDKFIEIDGVKRNKKSIVPPDSGDSTDRNFAYKTNVFSFNNDHGLPWSMAF